MNTLHAKRILGFTIIELMIVLVIVAVLVALAYPSYINYVRKSKRGEAQQLLLNWSINQEIWRSNNTTYNAITDPTSPSYMIPDHTNYNFNWPVAPAAATYTLRAVADGDQANDVAKNGDSCATLTLDQSGVKLPANCWD